MSFRLGEGIACDLDRLVDTRLLVQANSGGGKSWCLRRLLEQTHGRVQHLVIDPEGEFASLREQYDYVLAAKTGGDTATDPRSAKLLAERLLELGVSAILDIYELKAHDRVRFVRAFLEALVDAPKKLWHPALVVVDEAHVYCPQKGEAESAGAVIDLATRGRKRGFCAVFATQRLSKLHKDAAAECNNKLIGRTALDVDMARASDELGFSGREQQHSLRTLAPGEFYAFGPALSTTVKKVTIGSVVTTHPKAGARIAFTPPPPTDKVRAVLAKLADLPAEVEKRERTLADLQHEVSDLRRQLAQRPQVEPAAPIEIEIVRPETLKRIEWANDQARGVVDQLRTLVEEYGTQARTLAAEMSRTRVPQRVPAPTRAAPRPRIQGSGPGEHMASGERKILTALAHYPDGRTKVQVAVLSGYAVEGGGFNNYLGALRSRGWIEGGSERLVITDDGIAALGSYEPLPSGRALYDYWRAQLGKAEALILEALYEHPRGMTKEAVADATGYVADGGGFNNALGRLRTLELVKGRGELRATEEFFQ